MPADDTSVTLALLYRRVSTDDQARDGASLPAQRSGTRQYALRRGWAIAGEFDDVLSGLRDDRAGYRALLASARELKRRGARVVVVVMWLDRLGRSVFERARCAEELRRLDVGVHSLAEGGQVPELVSNLLAAVAAEESRRLHTRVVETRRHLSEAGWHFPGRAPWGYAWRSATAEERASGAPARVLEPHPVRARYVAEAFRRLDRGQALATVAAWIARHPEEVGDGRCWDARSTRRVLSSAVYAGRTLVGRPDILSRPRAHWPPLVPDAIWASVHQRLCGTPRVRRPPERSFLSGLVRCPRCGGCMVVGRRRRETSAYRCAAGRRVEDASKPRCSGTVPLRVIDALVLAELLGFVERFVSDSEQRHAWLRRHWRLVAATCEDESAGEQRRLQQAADAAHEAWAEAALLLADGRISPATYRQRRDRAHAEMALARHNLALLQERASESGPVRDLDTAMAVAQAWIRAAQSGDAPPPEAVRALVRRVRPRRLQHARYRVEVEWTLLAGAIQALSSQSGPPSHLPVLSGYGDVLLFRGEAGGLSATTVRRRTRDLAALRQLPPEAFEAVPARDRALLELYCGRADGEPKTWQELAGRFGIQPARVGQILRRWCPFVLGRGPVPRGWTRVRCSVCGTDLPVTVWAARNEADHACGRACYLELRKRLALRAGRPRAGALRALPAAALDQLTADRRRLIVLYYGLQGEAEHSLEEVRLKMRMGRNRALRLLREAEEVLLGPAPASGQGLMMRALRQDSPRRARTARRRGHSVRCCQAAM